MELELEKLREQRKALREQARAIQTAADDEHREMDVNELRKFDDTMTQHDQLDARIKREERLQAAETEAGRSYQAPTKPELGETVKAEVAGPRRFRSFGEQMQAVIRASRPGGTYDPRLEVRAPMGMGEGLGSDGGFLVQTDFAQELIKNTYATGQVANRCRRITLTSNANSIKIPAIDETTRVNGSRWGGVAAAWTAEAGTKVASAPSFREINLTLNKLTALGYATDELLADAGALESLLMQAFSEEIGFRLDDAIINGNGAGQPLGVLAGPCLVSVAAEGGQPAATVVAENLIKMYSRMYAPSRNNAVWFINQNVEPQLMQMSMAVGGGGQMVYMPAGGLSQAPYGSIFGRPVVPIEQCATLGTVGDVIFADMSQYLLVDKGGLQSASSIHVRFVNDESTFRFVYRVAGQPVWGSVLTPFNGGAGSTMSPFVALATRS